MHTRFTELIGCRLPFQLAVLGGVGTGELARAVAGAGGLGMVPGGCSVAEPRSGSLGMGFLIPCLPPLADVVAAADGLRVAEFSWGEPDSSLVAAAHSATAVVSWQVGDAEEAQRAETAGCDMVVIQGIEAGGHVRGTRPLDALLAETLDAVSIPVVAAGGIGSAVRVAELIGAGADAVRVGTRFLACPECDTHRDYVSALIAASADDTVLTEHFDDDGRWPAPVRVLRVSLDAATAAGNHTTGPPTALADSPHAMACYAGTSVDHVHAVTSAAHVVRELTSLLD